MLWTVSHEVSGMAAALTVGKYPSVKTLRRLVLPQAPSPIITSFLDITQQLASNLRQRTSDDAAAREASDRENASEASLPAQTPTSW